MSTSTGKRGTRAGSRKRLRLDEEEAGVEGPSADQTKIEQHPLTNGLSVNHESQTPISRPSRSKSRPTNAPPDPASSHSATSAAPLAQAATATDSSPVAAGVAGAASPLKEMVGYCFCRDWRVVIKDPVAGVVVCHCKDCQAISSSFFCTYVTAKSRALLIVEPTDRTARNVLSSTFYYTITEGENTGKNQSRTFCARCGTVLFATPESLEGALPINRNLFLTPENEGNKQIEELLSPKMEIFVRDRNNWRPGDKNIVHEWNGMPGHL